MHWKLTFGYLFGTAKNLEKSTIFMLCVVYHNVVFSLQFMTSHDSQLSFVIVRKRSSMQILARGFSLHEQMTVRRQSQSPHVRYRFASLSHRIWSRLIFSNFASFPIYTRDVMKTTYDFATHLWMLLKNDLFASASANNIAAISAHHGNFNSECVNQRAVNERIIAVTALFIHILVCSIYSDMCRR